MINVLNQLAVDDTDVYQTAGSQLRRAPADGEYRLWFGSDQVDGQIDVTVAGARVVEPSEARVITVNALNLDGDPDFAFKVQKGDDVIVNYNEVTGGTASLYTKFLDVVDLLFEAGNSPADVVAELELLE